MSITKPRKLHAVLKGLVVGEVSFHQFETGKQLLKFNLRTNDGIYEITAWEKLALTYESKIIEGINLELRGTYRDEFAKSEKRLTASAVFLLDIDEEGRLKESSNGSVNKSDLLRYQKRREEEGYIRASFIRDGQEFTRYFPQCDCIQGEGGKWWLKLDFIMNKHGEGYLCKILREHKFGDPSTKAWVPKYRNLINSLLGDGEYETEY